MATKNGPKNKGGRPKGKAARLSDVLLPVANMAALNHIATQTGNTPEKVAAWLIHAGLWRSESILVEINRAALEEARRVIASDPGEGSDT